MANRVEVWVQYSSGRTERSGKTDRKSAAILRVGIEQNLRRKGFSEVGGGVWEKGSGSTVERVEVVEQPEQ